MKTEFGSAELISVAVAQFKPQVYSYEVKANVTDPRLNRDSCSSVKLGSRAFWTCRDTSYKRLDGSWSFPFVNSVGSLETYSNGISKYPTIQTALAIIQAEVHKRDSPAPVTDTCGECEYGRLACLLFMIMTIQSSIDSHPSTAPLLKRHGLSPSAIDTLETFLYEHIPAGVNSTEGLYNLLFYGFTLNPDKVSTIGHVMNLATIISIMSFETRRGVERFLLHILRQVPAEDWHHLEDHSLSGGLLSPIYGD